MFFSEFQNFENFMFFSEFQNFFSFRCFLRGEMKIHHKTKRGLNTLKLGHVLKF